MERELYEKLVEWKESELRKPLILRGARQVGKTYLLKQFGSCEYDDTLYINFDETPQLRSIFQLDLNPDRILKELEIYSNKKIRPKKTILIFDEIQECEEALRSLKYFCEKRNEFHIVAAGSLLGVKLSQSFPVGKVNFLELGAMNFFEFLKALGEVALLNMLQQLRPLSPISDIFHEKLVYLLKHYFIIGGMPEAVDAYIKTESFEQVRRVQKDILDAYLLDFAKHAPKEDVMRILEIWQSIPNQLARENKKFIFAAVKSSARAKNYGASIQWLKGAGLIIQVHHVSVPKLPLDAYADKQTFKIYLLDIGLLGAMSLLEPRIILEGNELFQEFKGALTENYVAQQLQGSHFDQLFYWTSEGRAEVDFIIAHDQKIFPLEVKSGTSSQMKSLIVYRDKFSKDDHSPPVLSRTSLRNFESDSKGINYPLYAISLFPHRSIE